MDMCPLSATTCTSHYPGAYEFFQQGEVDPNFIVNAHNRVTCMQCSFIHTPPGCCCSLLPQSHHSPFPTSAATPSPLPPPPSSPLPPSLPPSLPPFLLHRSPSSYTPPSRAVARGARRGIRRGRGRREWF